MAATDFSSGGLQGGAAFPARRLTDALKAAGPPLLFLGGLALWGGASALAATLLRNFAAYSAALAGYTPAIVAGDLLGATGGVNADAAFLLAVSRGSEIIIGIVRTARTRWPSSGWNTTPWASSTRRMAPIIAALGTKRSSSKSSMSRSRIDAVLASLQTERALSVEITASQQLLMRVLVATLAVLLVAD